MIPDVRTADVDFDKRIDIIQSIDLGGGSVEYRIWFNLGDQTYSPSITVPQNFGFVFSDTGVQIADFNGDRVPDIAQIRPTDVIVTAGLGYGNFADPVTVNIPDYVLTDTQIAQAKLMDITGDGLADLVIERAAPGELWYWVNLGNYTFSTRKVITGHANRHRRQCRRALGGHQRQRDHRPDLCRFPIHAPYPGRGRWPIDQWQPGTQPAHGHFQRHRARDARRLCFFHQLPRFRTSPPAIPGPTPCPFPVQVVAAVTNLDSLGHQYVTQFSYHNGYYDPVEKQFRGFGGADQMDLGDPTAPTLVTRSVFDTGQTVRSDERQTAAPHHRAGGRRGVSGCDHHLDHSAGRA